LEQAKPSKRSYTKRLAASMDENWAANPWKDRRDPEVKWIQSMLWGLDIYIAVLKWMLGEEE
jgi:hypothetical protein